MDEGAVRKRRPVPVRVPIEGVLDLHTFLPKEIPSLVEEYLKECLEARVYSVRLIHGKGKGVQRHRIHSLLKRLAIVGSFLEAPASAGGWGATVVELKRQRDLPSAMWPEFRACMKEGARALGMHLDRVHMEQFALHARELVEWNRFANLTALKDAKELAEKLFLDALPLVPVVPANSRVLDIGSGGGFPGLPLRVMRPDLEIVLIDASRKKANFLRHVIRTLDLRQIEARHLRAEVLARKIQGTGRPYDVIVSKAAFKLERLVDHALPILRTRGMIIAMKGVPVEPELEGARQKIKSAGLGVEVTKYRLPGLGIERSLVILNRG